MGISLADFLAAKLHLSTTERVEEGMSLVMIPQLSFQKTFLIQSQQPCHPGSVHHKIQSIRMRYSWSDYGAWKDLF